jgi:uncharacterized protein (TIGR02266 family)
MAKPVVLIIDDEPYFLLMTKEMVEDAGYTAIISNDVDEGVQLFYEKKPDLLLLDIVMPGEFGTEVCRDLKETEQGRNTPIILMSSGVKEMSGGEGLIEYKADEYILKPIEIGIFTGLLSKYLRKTDSPMLEPSKGIGKEVPGKEITQKDWFNLKDLKESKPAGKRKVTEGFLTNKVTEDVIKIEQGDGCLILHLRIETKTKYIFTANSMININNGGIFITSNSPAPLGTKVQMKVDCGGEVLELKSVVIWVQPANLTTGQASGMGIRFSDQKSESIAKIRNFLNSMTV